ncbi:unnamed protein product [Lymnaea stagnalis]|uniref:Uncharacterized protein n=1 Tax=Lymnaea stagnalis TaxID=6523 RepID=A0AAV2HDE4_LYMST
MIPKTLTLNITTDGASRNSLNRADNVSAKRRRQKIAATRTKSESEKFALMRSTRKNSLSSRPLKMLSNNVHCRSKSFSSKGGNVIMEEELDPEMDEIRDDFRACLQMIHAENEMSKL